MTLSALSLTALHPEMNTHSGSASGTTTQLTKGAHKLSTPQALMVARQQHLRSAEGNRDAKQWLQFQGHDCNMRSPPTSCAVAHQAAHSAPPTALRTRFLPACLPALAVGRLLLKSDTCYNLRVGCFIIRQKTRFKKQNQEIDFHSIFS